MPYWAAGNRITATRLAGFDLTEWDDYTPEWTASTTNPTIGNGTLAGRYIQAGDTVFVRAYLKVGSTSTNGSGAYSLSMPVEAAATVPQALSGWLVDASESDRYPVTVLLTGTFVRILDSTASFGVSSTSPFTWAVNDEILIAGIYEAA